MKTLPSKPTAVVLMQFGGPDSLDAVEPFLYNLFRDKDIIQIPVPFLLQKPLAKLISSRRAKTVRQKYGEIGGKSPIVEKTQLQKTALQNRLDVEYGKDTIPVLLAMRYWKPYTQSAIDTLCTHGIQNVVLLPLYAQYSKTNAGSSYNEWNRNTQTNSVVLHERRIQHYHLSTKYISAINERIDTALQRFSNADDVHILFSAHGIPIDLVFEGDVYPRHVRETMEAVMEARLHKNSYSLSYQSKVGPKQWLTPSTEMTIKELGYRGCTKLLIVPIAFVSDHIETLHELDIELREVAENAGMKEYRVTEGLNDMPTFIDALFDLIVEQIASFK